MHYGKLNDATKMDHYLVPFIDQILNKLADDECYCFFYGYSGYNQIVIALEDQDKTILNCPYVKYAFTHMLFGLSNALDPFKRCMMSIFHDIVEDIFELFMGDFSVFGDSFEHCLSNLERLFSRCEKTNLLLKFEKCNSLFRE